MGFFLFFLMGCQIKLDSQGPRGDVLHCLSGLNVSAQNYQVFDLPNGVQLENNVWGFARIPPNKSWYQCLLQFPDSGNFGWTFSIPRNQWYVISYPLMRWSALRDSRWPFSIDQVQVFELELQWHWHDRRDFIGNFAPEVWFHDGSEAVNESTFFDFTKRPAELMVWLESYGGMTTGAQCYPDAFTTREGITFDLCVNLNHQSHNMTFSWVYGAFVARRFFQTAITLDWKQMIEIFLQKVRDLKNDSAWCQNCQILSLEVGTEIIAGSGTFELKKSNLILSP